MSAVFIKICHDCKLATKEGYAVVGNYEGTVSQLQKFIAEHPGHTVRFESDASGQIASEQYNFETRQFDWDGWL